MLSLGLSAIYETGEVPWGQDAEQELVYNIPWEANTAPVDIPYMLLRRSEGLSARHVAALAQKWGAFMWEDGFQVRLTQSLTPCAELTPAVVLPAARVAGPLPGWHVAV